jgi:YbbR domain-containing protein
MDWLLKNIWLKLVAFGLAFLVWVHVATEKTYTYEFRLPISEISLAEGLTLSTAPPESLVVNITGTGKQLLRRKWRQDGIRINAAQYPAGRFTLNLTTQNSALARQAVEVMLDEILSPTSIRLEIDAESTVALPIRADIETTADEGFAAGQQIELQPDSAKLIGPRSKIMGIESVTTEHRRLGSLRNTVTITLPLALPEGYGFRLEPDSVAVTVPVFPAKTRIFEDVPIMIFNAPVDKLPRIAPDRVRLEVTGPPADIDQLGENSLTVSVDYRDRDSSGRARLKFDCPPEFRLRSISVDSVLIVDPSHADPRH